jgi:diguanylate cyclase (GGDEF)-like protein
MGTILNFENVKSILSQIFLFIAYIITLNVLIRKKLTSIDKDKLGKLIIFCLTLISSMALIYMDHLTFDHNPYSFLSFTFIIGFLGINAYYEIQAINKYLILSILVFRFLLFYEFQSNSILFSSVKFIYLYASLYVGLRYFKKGHLPLAAFLYITSLLVHWFEILLLLKSSEFLIYIGISVLLYAVTISIFRIMTVFNKRFNFYYVHSHKDYLTNLYNSRYLSSQLNALIKKGSRKICYVFIDLNDLKKINDTYGHDYGDRALVIIAKQLKGIYAGGYIFRKSGDEFVVLIEGSRQTIYEKSQNLLESLMYNQLLIGTDCITLKVSIGIVELQENTNEYMVFDQADQAMYQAKKNRSNKSIYVV